MRKIAFYLIVLVALCSCTAEKTVYMFSYFMHNGQDGLHLAYSHDGLTWQTLNNGESFLTPEAYRPG